MTNVPDDVRQAWKELYILFDTNYNMDGSEEAWIEYWLFEATPVERKRRSL